MRAKRATIYPVVEQARSCSVLLIYENIFSWGDILNRTSVSGGSVSAGIILCIALYSWFTVNVEFDGNEIMKTGCRLLGVYGHPPLSGKRGHPPLSEGK